MPLRLKVLHCRRSRLVLLGLLTLACLPVFLDAQDFSEWNQATGYKKVQYRWRQNEAKGCDVEYRNTDERDHKKYKSRIVFQNAGDEHEKPYTLVSFADPPPYVETIPACSEVTDVSVTRF